MVAAETKKKLATLKRSSRPPYSRVFVSGIKPDDSHQKSNGVQLILRGMGSLAPMATLRCYGEDGCTDSFQPNCG
jgi:hypothetical protein